MLCAAIYIGVGLTCSGLIGSCKGIDLIFSTLIISSLKWPKIPHGVSFFGLIVGAYSIFNTKSKAEEQRRAMEQQHREQIESLHNKVDQLKDQVEESSRLSALDKSKKFIENFNSFSITDIIQRSYDFWNGFI